MAGVVLLWLLAAACEDPAEPKIQTGPVVEIIVPEGVERVSPGDTLFLTGRAFDPLTGSLSDSTLFWAVDGEEAGRGATLALEMDAGVTREVVLEARSPDAGGVSDTLRLSAAEGGMLLWAVPVPVAEMAYHPASATLYLLRDGELVALDRHRSVRWRTRVDPASPGARVWNLRIAPDGAALVQVHRELVMVGADGAVRWRHREVTQYNGGPRTAIGPDGTVWVSSRSTCCVDPMEPDTLSALSSGGELLWERPVGAVLDFVDGRGRAWMRRYRDRYAAEVWSRNGELLHTFDITEAAIAAGCPAPSNINQGTRERFIPGGGDRVLFRVAGWFSLQGCLLAVNVADGTVAWALAPAWYEVDTDPIVGRNGQLFFGTGAGEIIALSSEGTELWSTVPITGHCSGGPLRTSGAPVALRDGGVLHQADSVTVVVDASGGRRWLYEEAESPVLGCPRGLPVGTPEGRAFISPARRSTLRAFALSSGADPGAPWGQHGGGPLRNYSTPWAPPSLP